MEWTCRRGRRGRPCHPAPTGRRFACEPGRRPGTICPPRAYGVGCAAGPAAAGHRTRHEPHCPATCRACPCPPPRQPRSAGSWIESPWPHQETRLRTAAGAKAHMRRGGGGPSPPAWRHGPRSLPTPPGRPPDGRAEQPLPCGREPAVDTFAPPPGVTSQQPSMCAWRPCVLPTNHRAPNIERRRRGNEPAWHGMTCQAACRERERARMPVRGRPDETAGLSQQQVRSQQPGRAAAAAAAGGARGWAQRRAGGAGPPYRLPRRPGTRAVGLDPLSAGVSDGREGAPGPVRSPLTEISTARKRLGCRPRPAAAATALCRRRYLYAQDDGEWTGGERAASCPRLAGRPPRPALPHSLCYLPVDV